MRGRVPGLVARVRFRARSRMRKEDGARLGSERPPGCEAPRGRGPSRPGGAPPRRAGRRTRPRCAPARPGRPACRPPASRRTTARRPAEPAARRARTHPGASRGGRCSGSRLLAPSRVRPAAALRRTYTPPGRRLASPPAAIRPRRDHGSAVDRSPSSHSARSPSRSKGERTDAYRSADRGACARGAAQRRRHIGRRRLSPPAPTRRPAPLRPTAWPPS
jgi:hypothetical protein